MAFEVEFENGQIIEFEKKPSQKDIEEVANSFQNISQASPQAPQQSDLTRRLSTSDKIEPTGDKIIDTLIGIQKEFVGPLAQGANTAAFGLPKFLTKAIAGKEFAQQAFPQQSTGTGKALRFGSEATGLLGGGAATLSRKAGMRITPNILGQVGLVASQGANAARRSAVLANKITKAAVEGAVFGGTQLDISGQGDPTFGGQLGQAATGGVFGAGLGILGASGRKIGRSIKKFRTPSKTPSAGALTKGAKDISGRTVSFLKEQQKVALEEIDDAIAKARAARKGAKFENRLEFGKKLRETTQTLRRNVEVLDDALKVESEQAAREVQKRLPKFYKTNSQIFGKRLDEISGALSKSGDDISIAEIDDVLKNVIADLDDALIIDGRPRDVIQFLKNKYGVQILAEPSRFVKASTGTQPHTLFSNVDERIPIRQLFSDLKNVKKTLSAGAQKGTSRFTQEDVAVAIFDNHFAGLLETRAPSLVKLRETYAPVIEAMKASNKIFKPFQGRFDTGKGASVFKKFATTSPEVLAKTQSGELSIIQAIEQGQGFAPGIGKITPKLRTLGNDLKLAKSRIQPVLDELRDTNLIFREGVDRKFLEQIQKLQADKKFIQANSVIQENLIIKELEKRLTEIGIRKNIIANLTQDKKKVMNFIRTSFFLAGGAGALIGISKGFSRR